MIQKSTLAFKIQAPPLVPIYGSELFFPVRRIWCVGRNFVDHALEMGGQPEKEPPFFFAKPADAVVPLGGVINFPTKTEDLHHEVELAVAIGKPGQNIPADSAHDHIFGYAVALDMTRRDVQAEAKRKGRPWDLAKGFDESCPVSAINRSIICSDFGTACLSLQVNGVTKQSAQIGDMILSVEECLSELSQWVKLEAGDLLLTGTPAGVGPVKAGDVLSASCDGVGQLDVHYTAARDHR